MRARVIINPMAGRGRRLEKDISHLESIFASHGMESHTICQQMRGHGTLLAKEAVAEGFDVVVAVGGDGTVNEVVCGLVNSGVPLGIVPAGSGNGLAREFGIPLRMEEACQSIIKGQTRAVDVGRMNGRCFLGTAGAGYDGFVVKLFEQKWGNRRGLLPYLHVALMGFFEHEIGPVRLKLNGRKLTVLPLLVTAANATQFGGRAVIAPKALPDDGLLDLCVIDKVNFFQAFYHWPKLFMGSIDRMPQWQTYRTDCVEISSDSPLPIHVDGEPLHGTTRLKIDVLPKALHIRVPRT